VRLLPVSQNHQYITKGMTMTIDNYWYFFICWFPFVGISLWQLKKIIREKNVSPYIVLSALPCWVITVFLSLSAILGGMIKLLPTWSNGEILVLFLIISSFVTAARLYHKYKSWIWYRVVQRFEQWDCNL